MYYKGSHSSLRAAAVNLAKERLWTDHGVHPSQFPGSVSLTVVRSGRLRGKYIRTGK